MRGLRRNRFPTEATGLGDREIYHRPSGIEDHPQPGNVQGDGAVGGGDELRQKGEEEQCHLGIENIGDDAS
jgi:hypothetical protein